MNYLTVEQIAAKYGVDPDDTDCTGVPSGPQTPKTAAQKLADRIKSSGGTAAGQQRR
jgi:hypothetical protein